MDSNANSTETNNNPSSHTCKELRNFLRTPEELINKYAITEPLTEQITTSVAPDYSSSYLLLYIIYCMFLGLLLIVHVTLCSWILSNTALLILGTIAVLPGTVMLWVIWNNNCTPVPPQAPALNGYDLLGLN